MKGGPDLENSLLPHFDIIGGSEAHYVPHNHSFYLDDAGDEPVDGVKGLRPVDAYFISNAEDDELVDTELFLDFGIEDPLRLGFLQHVFGVGVYLDLR